MALDIHRATDDDIVAIAELKALDDTECTGKKVTADQAFDKLMSVFRDIRADTAHILVAVLDGAPVGYGLGRKQEDIFESLGIFVTLEARLQGIATALKQAQIDFAISRSCSEVHTSCAISNIGSIALQQKFNAHLKSTGNGFISSVLLSQPDAGST